MFLFYLSRIFTLNYISLHLFDIILLSSSFLLLLHSLVHVLFAFVFLLFFFFFWGPIIIFFFLLHVSCLGIVEVFGSVFLFWLCSFNLCSSLALMTLCFLVTFFASFLDVCCSSKHCWNFWKCALFWLCSFNLCSSLTLMALCFVVNFLN